MGGPAGCRVPRFAWCRAGGQPQYGWSLLALHAHIVSSVSVSATNSTASGARVGSVSASATLTGSGGRVSSSTATAVMSVSPPSADEWVGASPPSVLAEKFARGLGLPVEAGQRHAGPAGLVEGAAA